MRLMLPVHMYMEAHLKQAYMLCHSTLHHLCIQQADRILHTNYQLQVCFSIHNYSLLYHSQLQYMQDAQDQHYMTVSVHLLHMLT